MTPKIINLIADYSVDRGGVLPCAIIVHGTGGRDSRGTLQHGDGRRVSIHTLHAKDGTIYRMVPDERGANHAGAPTSSFKLGGKLYVGGQVNKVTLGVEIENLQNGTDPYTNEQANSVGWQIDQWRKKYGALPIMRHATLDPTRRRDPLGLPVPTIEQWIARFAPPPVFPRLFKANKQAIIFERSDGQGPLFPGTLNIGELVHVDKADYPEKTAHLLDGRGFVRLADLDEVK